FLHLLLKAMAAPAGAVWLPRAGLLLQQFQVNIEEVGLEHVENGEQTHDELIRQAMLCGQPGFLWPHGRLDAIDDKEIAANPTDFFWLVAPIIVNMEVAGLIEVWLPESRDPNALHGHPQAMTGLLQFMVRMASLASWYARKAALS